MLVVSGLLLNVVAASASDVTVLSAGALESAVLKLALHYQREFGREVEVAFATAPEIVRKLAGGSAADVLIAPVSVAAAASKAGQLVMHPQPEVARVGVGIAVRSGLAIPDVATAEALKAALLRADSVVYNQASTGQYLETLFEQMGIRGQLMARTTRYVSAAEVLEHVIRGRTNEIGFGPMTEIKDFAAKGLTFVGPLPKALQNYTTYVAAVMSGAQAPDAARDFVRYLTSAKAQQVFAETGAH